MSILANKDTYVVIQGGVAGVNAARRMAEFCYLIKRSLNVLAFVYPPDAGKTNRETWMVALSLTEITLVGIDPVTVKRGCRRQHREKLSRAEADIKVPTGPTGQFIPRVSIALERMILERIADKPIPVRV